MVRETLKRSGLDPAELGSVLMGNVVQAGNKMNPARQASIGGGVKNTSSWALAARVETMTGLSDTRGAGAIICWLILWALMTEETTPALRKVRQKK